MGDVALVPEGDVLQADERVAAHDPREPADALGDDRIPLVRHRRRSLLAAAEPLLHLGDLRTREVADLECELVERGGEDRERREELGVAVALHDLRRARCGLETEPLARDPLDLGLGRGPGADGAGELADADAVERTAEPAAVSVELEGPAGELEAERDRLRVDAV